MSTNEHEKKLEEFGFGGTRQRANLALLAGGMALFMGAGALIGVLSFSYNASHPKDHPVAAAPAVHQIDTAEIVKSIESGFASVVSAMTAGQDALGSVGEALVITARAMDSHAQQVELNGGSIEKLAGIVEKLAETVDDLAEELEEQNSTAAIPTGFAVTAKVVDVDPDPTPDDEPAQAPDAMPAGEQAE